MKGFINIDYLILNLSLSNPKMDFDGMRNEDFSFLLLRHSTRNFQNIGEIYFRGSHFATLTFNPYDLSIIKPDFAQLQIVNRFLYEPKKWFQNTLLNCLSWMGSEVTGVNRMDLAVDGLRGEIFKYDLPDLHALVTFSGKYCICGKEKDFDAYSTTKKGLKGWKMGSRSGDRFLRFYNKSKELEVKPKKYIQDYWRYTVQLTSEEMSRVWRFEYQLNRRFLRSLDRDNWQSIFSLSFLIETFKTANNGFCDVRINQNRTRETNNPKFELLDMSILERLKTKNEIFEPFKREQNIYAGKQLRVLKMTLKKFFWVYWRSQQTSSLSLIFANQIMDCNRVYFEDCFWNKKLALWIAEFENLEKLTYDFDYSVFKNDLKNTAGIEI